jgi:hypothetical protein
MCCNCNCEAVLSRLARVPLPVVVQQVVYCMIPHRLDNKDKVKPNTGGNVFGLIVLSMLCFFQLELLGSRTLRCEKQTQQLDDGFCTRVYVCFRTGHGETKQRRSAGLSHPSTCVLQCTSPQHTIF